MAAPHSFARKKFDVYVRELTALGNPIVLTLFALVFFGLDSIVLWIILGLVVNEIIGAFSKYFFHRSRPQKEQYQNALEKIDAGSFPSTHTSRAAFVCSLMIYHSNSAALSATLIAIIVLVGFTRVRLQKHYFSDVVGGLVLGIGLAALLLLFL